MFWNSSPASGVFKCTVRWTAQFSTREDRRARRWWPSRAVEDTRGRTRRHRPPRARTRRPRLRALPAPGASPVFMFARRRRPDGVAHGTRAFRAARGSGSGSGSGSGPLSGSPLRTPRPRRAPDAVLRAPDQARVPRGAGAAGRATACASRRCCSRTGLRGPVSLFAGLPLPALLPLRALEPGPRRPFVPPDPPRSSSPRASALRAPAPAAPSPTRSGSAATCARSTFASSGPSVVLLDPPGPSA